MACRGLWVWWGSGQETHLKSSLPTLHRFGLVLLLQLLPIPDSVPISPDDGEHADIYKLRIRVRGNLEWAPPRPQIIFNIHPAPT